jgi:hypothetical protein
MRKFFDQIREWLKSCSSNIITSDGRTIRAIPLHDALYVIDEAQEKWQDEEIDSKYKNTESVCQWKKIHLRENEYHFISGCKNKRIDANLILFSAWKFCPYCAGRIETAETNVDEGEKE